MGTKMILSFILLLPTPLQNSNKEYRLYFRTDQLLNGTQVHTKLFNGVDDDKVRMKSDKRVKI